MRVMLTLLFLLFPSACMAEILDGFWTDRCGSVKLNESNMSKGIFGGVSGIAIGPKVTRYILVAWPNRKNEYDGVWVSVPKGAEGRIGKDIVEGDEIAVGWHVKLIESSGGECIFSREGDTLSRPAR